MGRVLAGLDRRAVRELDQQHAEVRRLQHPRFCGSVVEHHADEGLSGPVRGGTARAGWRDDRHGRQPVAGPVADRPRAARRAHPDGQPGRRWRRPQAALPRGHRADQVRTGRRPADQQRCPDRDVPPDPLADPQQARLLLWLCAPVRGVTPAKPTTGEIPMSDFTVTRRLNGPRGRVWQVLTQPSHFEGWLPAKPGTAVLDVRTGGSWQATVISSGGEEIALAGRYDEVLEPDRLVMTVPGDVVTEIALTSAPDDGTQIAYTFDVDESMQAMVTESVDDVLSRVSKVLAEIA